MHMEDKGKTCYIYFFDDFSKVDDAASTGDQIGFANAPCVWEVRGFLGSVWAGCPQPELPCSVVLGAAQAFVTAGCDLLLGKPRIDRTPRERVLSSPLGL